MRSNKVRGMISCGSSSDSGRRFLWRSWHSRDVIDAASLIVGRPLTHIGRLRQHGLLALLAVFFFGSGLSALVYQVLWLRMLGWVFGVTIYAASAVWATFMAGLAGGSFAAGKAADRMRRPLAWFGVTELLIGATALATPRLLDRLQLFYTALHPALPDSLWVLTLARLAIAVALLIVPTTLMGATLPLVLRASTFRTGTLGREVGLLYGSNAAGAIVGTLAAGLYLIPGLGIQRTFFAAASVNLIVGASAIIVSGLAAGAPEVPPATAPGDLPATRPACESIRRDRGLMIVLIAFGVSGAVSLALEVVWFRVLILFLRPTVYSFSLMLATILGGIALGSYVATPLLARRWRWLTVLAVLELTIGVAIALSFRPLVYLNDLTEALTPLSRVMPGYLLHPLAGSLLAIFPTALLMGIAFPIALRVWASGDGRPERVADRVGRFYSLNVAGAIAGSLLGGFLLVPGVGSKASLVILATLSFGSGLALLTVADAARLWRAAIGVGAVVAFAVAVRASRDPFAEFIAQRYPSMDVTWKQEGVEATVVVHEFGARDRRRRALTINGNHQAGTDATTTFTHRQIGHLPMIVHPGARSALVIGLGGGATAGAVSIHDGVVVDVVELARGVLDGARLFGSINYNVVSRPNVHIRIDDGRNYMMLTSRRYDVITADVIQPIYAGAGNIYSVEYFRLMKRVLEPGGMVLQWIPGTEAEYKLIARTFLSVFPETTAWGNGSLFLGTVEPLRLSRRNFDSRLGLAGRGQGLLDVQIPDFDALLTTFAAGPDEIRAFAGPGPLLTDDRPLTEYFLSLPRDRQPALASLKGEVKRFVARED